MRLLRNSALALLILTSSFAAGWLLGWLIVVWKASKGEERKRNYVVHPRSPGSTITSSTGPPLRGAAPP